PAAAALALLAWFTFRDAREVDPPRTAGARTGGAGVAAAPGDRVRLPALRGMSDVRARAALPKLGFDVSAPKRHGVVIGTRPQPGSLARRGSTVRVLIAPAGKDRHGNG